MTGWQAPARSAGAARVYAAAEEQRLADPDAFRLDADAVAERAARDGEAFASGWRDGLEHYLGSAVEDGRLNAVGVRSVIGTAVARLRSGARLQRAVATSAAAAPALTAPPIVITGGWRSGTTFLFRLLAIDPRLRAPLPAELANPVRLAALRGDEREAALDAAAKAHETLHFLNPTLQAIHDSGPRLAEECVLAMGHDLRNWGFTSTVRLDGYADWLADADLGPGYARYRQSLELLDHGDGRRWLLKAPAHLAELDHLVDAFPGVTVVHLHRDIVDTVASASSLFAVFRSMYSDEVDPADIGRYQADQTERWLRRAAEFRRRPEAAGATFLDLDYRRLVTDPVAAIGDVYAASGLEPVDDPVGFVDRYRAAHPRRAHGEHAYTPADFGLDPDDLRDRFAELVP